MSKTAIRWKLGELLEREQITVYRLHEEMHGSASRNTLYRLAKEQPERIDLTITAHILEALGRASGKPYALTDLLEVETREVSRSGLPYTGNPETDDIVDDPELVQRLLAHRARFEGLSAAEEKAEIEKMLRTGELIPLERVLAELNG